MLTKGAPATRLATLHFLARHAFFVADAGTEVRTACPLLSLVRCLTWCGARVFPSCRALS